MESVSAMMTLCLTKGALRRHGAILAKQDNDPGAKGPMGANLGVLDQHVTQSPEDCPCLVTVR